MQSHEMRVQSKEHAQHRNTLDRHNQAIMKQSEPKQSLIDSRLGPTIAYSKDKARLVANRILDLRTLTCRDAIFECSSGCNTSCCFCWMVRLSQ